jgi:hypothetical protein
MNKPIPPKPRWIREETPFKLIISYIKYVIETASFNKHHKSLYSSSIAIFDNCSWREFKDRRFDMDNEY